MKKMDAVLKGSLFPVSVYFIWRVTILLYQILLQTSYKVTPDSLTVYQRIYLSWVTYWDSGHYINIAQNGYTYPQQAFFPLWPLLIKIITSLGLPLYVATYSLVLLLGVSTFVLFFVLAKMLVGADRAKWVLILFACFPSTMFLLAGYTEALFMTASLASFILLEKKSYLLSAIFGGLASMTRLVGAAVAIAYMLLQIPFHKKILYFVTSLSGVLFYMLYLQVQFGDALLFTKATQEWCAISNKCNLTSPFIPLIEYGQLVLMGWIQPNLSTPFIDWSAAVIFLLLSPFVFQKLNFTYFMYTLIVILLPLSTGSTVGMVRYVLIAFPVFFILPSLIRSRMMLMMISVLLFLLQLRFIALFTSRLWVA